MEPHLVALSAPSAPWHGMQRDAAHNNINNKLSLYYTLFLQQASYT